MTYLYEVVDCDDDYPQVYCRTTDKILADEVLKELVEGNTCKYVKYKTVQYPLHTTDKPPKITWIFFIDEDGMEINTEGEGSDFDTAFDSAWCKCYKIEAATLAKALDELKRGDS